jgi:apolipoprotein N-acyltransferase
MDLLTMTAGKEPRHRIIPVILSVSGGVLAGLAWTSWFPGLILLVAFIPFLILENYLFENQHKYNPYAFFNYALPGIIIFNILTLGWVRAASIPAVITVILGMSFLMTFIIWLAHIVRIRAGGITGAVAFISFWLSFEFLTLNFVILSPWINLGNGLAKDILFIQWYELTGTAGGTLWILSSNLFLSLFIIRKSPRKKLYLYIWLLLIFIPSTFSVTRYYTIRENKSAMEEVLIIQPNIDPYTEKFTIPFDEQLNKTLDMAGESVTCNTKWVLTPETTVDDPVNEDDMDTNKYILALREFAGHHPGISIVSGLVSYRLYPAAEEPSSASARKIDSSGYYYDHFNSAFLIDSGGVKGIYHKSKLVPGIEMQFSAGLGKLINRIVPYLGGTKWGYGIQEERTCFAHPITGQHAAPIICYESVFGNYVADYVRNGAEALFIITNDGWWKNTGGYKQHLEYASIRAIETRRPVARAANTGISCFIDIRGKPTHETQWWTEAVIRGEINFETYLTPYVRYGDVIMKLFAVISVLLLAYIFIVLPIRKKNMVSSSK